MSKLMWIAGILLMAIGVALGLMVFASPTSVVGWGITPQVAADLLVGGIVSIGLGGVINAVEAVASSRAEKPTYAEKSQAPAAPIPEFGRRAAEAAATTAAAAAQSYQTAPEVSEPVKETIAALEDARQKIENAFEPPPPRPAAIRPQPVLRPFETVIPVERPAVAPEPEPEQAPEPAHQPEPEPEIALVEEAGSEPAPEAQTEPEPEAEQEAAPEEAEEEVMEEGQLYVVEERFIRQRPARILSDGTVEAETDEGWMRFENLEHLDEYLDAMAPPARG